MRQSCFIKLHIKMESSCIKLPNTLNLQITSPNFWSTVFQNYHEFCYFVRSRGYVYNSSYKAHYFTFGRGYWTWLFEKDYNRAPLLKTIKTTLLFPNSMLYFFICRLFEIKHGLNSIESRVRELTLQV